MQDSSLVSFWPQHSEQDLTHGRAHKTCPWNELKPCKHAGALDVSVSWSLAQGQRPGQPLTPRYCLALRPWVAETPLASSNYLMPPRRLAHRTGLPGTHCQKVCIESSSSRKFPLIAPSTGHLPVSARLQNSSHTLSTLVIPVGRNDKANSSGRKKRRTQYQWASIVPQAKHKFGVHDLESESESCSVASDSLQPHGPYRPWNSPGQNTGVGSLSLLQGIFPTQGSNPGLLHCRWILYQLSHKGSPRILEWVAYPFSRGSSWPRNWTGVFCIAGGFFTNWAIRETIHGIFQARVLEWVAVAFSDSCINPHKIMLGYCDPVCQ